MPDAPPLIVIQPVLDAADQEQLLVVVTFTESDPPAAANASEVFESEKVQAGGLGSVGNSYRKPRERSLTEGERPARMAAGRSYSCSPPRVVQKFSCLRKVRFA